MFCAGHSRDDLRTQHATASRASPPRPELPMSIEAISALTLVVAIVGAGIAAAIVVRLGRSRPMSHQQDLETSLARLEQGLRDEFARGRQETAVGAKLLREEVQRTLTQLG